MDPPEDDWNFFSPDSVFESTHWTADDFAGHIETPVITPGFLSGASRVDENGSPVLDKLTFGVHWKESDYPAWTGQQVWKDAQADSSEFSPSVLVSDNHKPRALDDQGEDNRSGRFAPRISVRYIAAMTDQIRKALGFQFDVSVNVFELLMSQLDSRASRSSPSSALTSLHAEYISGKHANFRKWYFAAQMDRIDREYETDSGKAKTEVGRSQTTSTRASCDQARPTSNPESFHYTDDEGIQEEPEELSLADAEVIWEFHHGISSDGQKLVDLLIYIFCWSEANQVRFMPECLAFIVKCCRDYYYAHFPVFPQEGRRADNLPTGFFLNNVITPLYNCYRSYNYDCTDCGDWVRRDGDHKDFIGYDDMNQLFWFKEGIQRIKVKTNDEIGNQPATHEQIELIELAPPLRLLAMVDVDWSNTFSKSYRESRSWLHNVTNFSRIWILHASVFWFYTAFNAPSLYTPGYNYLNPRPPKTFVRLAIMSLGGLCGPIITLLSLVGELRFVPRSYPGARPVLARLVCVLLLLLLLAVPAMCNLLLNPWQADDFDLMPATVISGVTFALAILYTVYFSFQPLESVLGAALIGTTQKNSESSKRRFLANSYFTANFAKRSSNDTFLSWLMCLLTFAAKFTESYFFLTLSVRDPLRELRIMHLEERCIGDMFIFGTLICAVYPKIILVGVIFTDMTLFFLDTYLWYVIFNTLISISIAYSGGTSIWTPWRNVYSRLPHRIMTKLLAPNTGTKSVVSRWSSLRIVWNSIIHSMYRGSVLSREQALKLVHVNEVTLEPRFFTMEEDGKTLKSACGSSSAYQRISFFAQSLSTPMQPPIAVHEMPSFTVFVPHYKEKMVLQLSETMKADTGAKITVLEYLQGLYPQEWQNLVSELQHVEHSHYSAPPSMHQTVNEESLDFSEEDMKTSFSMTATKIDAGSHQLALKKLGFCTLDPSDTIRTQLWCSARTQTLYRTLLGFSNYNNALRVLCCAESCADESTDPQSLDKASADHADLCSRKFRLLVAMQLYSQFSAAQLEQIETIMAIVPDLAISYVERNKSNGAYYSCLFDSSCPLLESGRRQPRLRIKLSGNPFLGDGKSDNQNSALPFYRGEYIQLVDANQDNYIEECLKIRNILMEFETSPNLSASGISDARVAFAADFLESPQKNIHDIEACSGLSYADPTQSSDHAPVAIVGAREYILSENIGVLGDVAAGKEQTFGTLFSRTLARVGAKLHYGHPDFLNAIFMTTRGGVSKGQRGLHLNEDIYAGITAVLRGGRIKHSEYYQCGKGRDLGFVSILNFTAKIGAGMGEQMLSREYFYMGTQLPFDRFISFYYAHPGFHLNNTFIMVSLEMILMVMLWISSIASVSTACAYERKNPPNMPHKPDGCANVLALVDWIRRCVVSIFLVFFISLCPLFFQELTERGFTKSLIRVARHFASLSMLFEVFVCRIYARSFWEDLNIGGAKYVATGRGMATTRLPFHTLYAGYYPEIQCGLNSALMIWCASTSLWNPSYLWFWVTTVSLCICPILYNPHQFAFIDFFMDYRSLLKWFWNSTSGREGRAVGENSWITFNREARKKLTGVRRQVAGSESTKPSFRNAISSQVGAALLSTVGLILPYVYIGAQKTHRYQQAPENSAVLRIILITLIPIAANTAVAIVSYMASAGLHLCHVSRHGNIIAMLAHTMSLFALILSWWILYILESQQLYPTILGVLVIWNMHHLLHTTLKVLFIRRQREVFETSDPWWTGNWRSANLGWKYPLVFLEELLVKSMIEPLEYAYDFLACHIVLAVQIPVLMIPYIEKLHTLFLMWLRPSATSAAVRSVSVQRKRKLLVVSRCFCALFVLNIGLLISLIIMPRLLPKQLILRLERELDKLAAW